MRIYLIVCTWACLLASLRCSAQKPPSVPAQYQDIFNTVTSDINNFAATVDSQWDKSRYPVAYSSQLLSADSDLTTLLLSPNYYQYSVIAELNDLQALGVTAITFHVNFPTLLPAFYTDPSQYQAYLSFYTQLVSEIHGRGLKVIIENTTPDAYSGNNAGSFAPYLQSLDWNTYIAQRAQDAAGVAQLLKPDYLVLEAEPDAEATGVWQPTVGTVNGSVQMVQGMITAVRATGTTAQIGAGCGTWDSSFLQFEQAFSALALDFVDMHIYPVNLNYLPNALAGAQAIAAAGKQITISEMWAYKIADDELGVLDYTTVYSRDPFSFWEPVDQSFLRTIANFANYQHLTFITPFWSHYLSAYLDYSVDGSLTPSAVISTAAQAAGTAITAGQYTPTGMFWDSLITAGPDSTPPAIPAPPTVTSFSQTVANLAWTATTDNQGVAAYNLYRNGSLIATVNGLMTYTDQGLQAATPYTYTIAAFDAAHNLSPRSAATKITTLIYPDHTPPSVPTGLAATAVSDTQVALSWTASTDNVAVVGYEIYRGSSPTSLSPWAITPNTTYLDTKSAPSTTYYYAVDAYDAFNNHSAKSTAVKVTTLPDTHPPTTPGSVTAVALSGSSVLLSWWASTDDYYVSSYKIYKGMTATNLVFVAATPNSTLTYTDSNVSSGKTYYYAVAATDLAKNVSPLSPTLTVSVK